MRPVADVHPSPHPSGFLTTSLQIMSGFCFPLPSLRVLPGAVFPNLPVLSCLFCFANWSIFALEQVVPLCPATLGLRIVPKYLCCIWPCIWPFACFSDLCSAALLQSVWLPSCIWFQLLEPPPPRSEPYSSWVLRRDGWTSLTIWLFSVPRAQYLCNSVVPDSHFKERRAWSG